jgi:hypothetical protein
MCSLKIRHCLVATLCMLGLLTCAAQEGINGEATYIAFEVPGALGTYPMSVNNSMAVTGYYYVSPAVARGFVRETDGAITTFDVLDGVWTEPKSINDAGEITGFYEVVAGVPQSFIRYAGGQIITFNPPCTAPGPCNLSAPVSINASGEIAGNYPFLAAGVFSRLHPVTSGSNHRPVSPQPRRCLRGSVHRYRCRWIRGGFFGEFLRRRSGL